MKIRNILLIAIIFTSSLYVYSEERNDEKKLFISIGGPYFGGGVIGLEAEFLLSNNVGFSIGGSYLGVNSGLFYHFKESLNSSYIYSSYNISFDKDISNQSIILAVGTREVSIFDFRVGIEYNILLSEQRKDYYKNTIFLSDLLPISFIVSIAIGIL